MENIINLLTQKGFTVNKKRTLHDSGSSFYQLEKDGVIYPKSRGNKADIGQDTITTCYEKFGLTGVLNLFDADE